MAADPADLSTVEAFKEYLGIRQPDDADLIQRLVTGASRFILNYTRRQFKSGTVNEVFLGHGTSRYRLREAPVTAFTSLTVDAIVVPATARTLVDDVLLLDGYSFVRGRPCTAIYTAGFAAVPADVAQACIDIAASKYRQRTRVDEDTKVLTGSGEQITFGVRDMHPATKAVLDNYIRWRTV